MKKILSIILVLLTVLSLMPASITADTVQPTPTFEPMPKPNEFYFYTYPATDITSTSAWIHGYCEVINNGFGIGDAYGSMYYRKKGDDEWSYEGNYFIYLSTGVGARLKNLEPNTTYEFYAGGTGKDGEILEFTTLPETPGDPNGDGVSNINDLVYMVEYISTMASGSTLDTKRFPNGTFICGLESARITDDEEIDVNDVVLLTEYIGTLTAGETPDPDKFPNGKLPRMNK